MDAVKVKDLSFAYEEGQNVLKNISFSIPKGSYTTIIGHNGSGKSTLAKLMMGLLEPASGQIEILEKPLTEENLSEIRSHAGIVFQNPDNQFIGSTVADDIAFGLENHCVPTEEMQDKIVSSAARVGMEKYLDFEPTNLSGGQKQRVAIAGILAMEPDLIIFDESTSMLDPQGKASVNKQIQKLNQDKGLTIVSITHDMEEAAQSENVIVLEDGKVVMQGRPEEIFSNDALIEKLRLDLPFAMKASRKLVQDGVLKKEALNLDDLMESLCQLK